MKLTLKQKSFADIYIELGNATEAYIQAGYSATSRAVAEANARKLLGNYSVKNYIEERMKQKEDNRIMKQDEVLSLLTSIARAELRETVVISTPMGAEERQKEPSFKDRLKALELLGKRYATFTDKKEVEVTLPVFIDDISEDD